MKKIYFLILAFVFVGSIPAIAFGEDVFAPVRKVYMNDGKMIECQMGWLDGARDDLSQIRRQRDPAPSECQF